MAGIPFKDAEQYRGKSTHFPNLKRSDKSIQ